MPVSLEQPAANNVFQETYPQYDNLLQSHLWMCCNSFCHLRTAWCCAIVYYSRCRIRFLRWYVRTLTSRIERDWQGTWLSRWRCNIRSSTFKHPFLDYPSLLEPLRSVLPFSAFILAAFSALRLAKFNLDTRQTTSFIGLPTPACALFWGALIVSFRSCMEQHLISLPILLAGILVSCWLLVSEVPMFALKFKHWGIRGNELKYGFIAFSCVALVSGIAYGIITADYAVCYSPLCIIILAYILVSVLTQKK